MDIVKDNGDGNWWKQHFQGEIIDYVKSSFGWLFLVTATVMPFVVGWGEFRWKSWEEWAWLLAIMSPYVIGGMIVASTKLITSPSYEWEGVLEFAGWIFPPVHRFVTAAKKDHETVHHTTEVIANLRSVFITYGILNIDDMQELIQKTGKDGRPFTWGLVDLVEKVANKIHLDDLQSCEATPTALADCIMFLYADTYVLPEEQNNTIKRKWGERKNQHFCVLRVLVQSRLANSVESYTDSQVNMALRSLEDQYKWDELIKKLRQARTVVVEKMVRVLETYGITTPGKAYLTSVSHDLERYSGDKVVRECAERFARGTVKEKDVESKEHLFELLYRDYLQLPAYYLWDKYKNDLIEELKPIIGNAEPYKAHLYDKDHKVVHRVLSALEDKFEMSLVRDVGVRLEQLWCLIEGYSAYLAENDRKSKSTMSIDDFLDLVEKKLPAVRSDLSQLKMHSVDLDILLEHGRKRIGNADFELRDDIVNALSCVSVGLYLKQDHNLQEELIPDIARYSARCPYSDRVTEILYVVLMWSYDGSKLPSIKELAKHCSNWKADATDRNGNIIPGNLLNAIRTELHYGNWPTIMPVEKTTAYLIKQIEELIRERETTNVPDKIVKLNQQFRDIKEKIGGVRESWSGKISDETSSILDSIQGSKDLRDQILQSIVSEFKQKLSDEIRGELEAVSSLQLSTLAGEIDDLIEVEHDHVAADEIASRLLTRLSDDVGKLTEAEKDHVMAIRLVSQLLERDLCCTAYYMITYSARKGRLSNLLNYLSKYPYSYDIRHYTPYARIGPFPHGMSLDDFYEKLRKDLLDILDKNLVEGVTRESLENAMITVQLISHPMWRPFP